MRILLVAMAESIHTVRWIKQFKDLGWDIHLFPCVNTGTEHPELDHVTIHHTLRVSKHLSYKDLKVKKVSYKGRNIVVKGFDARFSVVFQVLQRILTRYYPGYHFNRFAKLLKKYNFDLVHSLEIQHAGYLTAEAKSHYDGVFPPWLATNWGCDICLFSQLADHKAKIVDVLKNCNYFSAECHRDIKLARQLGFSGESLPVVPVTGGFDLNEVSKLREGQAPSRRKKIMLKGYQSWAGRSLFALKALEECADLLKGYELCIYSATLPDVQIAAELFSVRTGIQMTLIPGQTSHAEMLRAFGEARCYIGLSIGDGISTSMLEAMTMGAFPIQSNTGCANEWVVDGETAFVVPPEDIPSTVRAIRRALSEDALVDAAAEKNWQTIKKQADYERVKEIATTAYENIYHRRPQEDEDIVSKK